MRPLITIFSAIVLVCFIAALSGMASDAQSNRPPFQEFDTPAAVQGDRAENRTTQSDAAKGAPTPQPLVTRQEGVAKPSTPTQDNASFLAKVLSFITPSKEDLEKSMDAIVAPKDEPSARPGPHWRAASAAHMRY